MTTTGIYTADGQLNTSAAASSTAAPVKAQINGADASSTNRYPVDTVVQSTPVSRSGTITAGGTAQVLMPANTNRRGWEIQNQSASDIYVSGLGNATPDQNSLRIPAGALYETPSFRVSTAALSVYGATTGQAFYAREY